MKASQDRMERLQKRLLKVYGVDFMNKKNYTKVIKTDGKSIEETVQEIMQTIKEYKKNRKLDA
jgi:cytidylate kinase